MNFLFAILAFMVGAVSALYVDPYGGHSLSFAIQPPPLTANVFQPTFHHIEQPKVLAHRDVVLNAQNEATLSPELLNPFYKNPRIAEALAKESWFTPGEEQVFDREAGKIPRVEVAKIFKHAGFIRR